MRGRLGAAGGRSVPALDLAALRTRLIKDMPRTLEYRRGKLTPRVVGHLALSRCPLLPSVSDALDTPTKREVAAVMTRFRQSGQVGLSRAQQFLSRGWRLRSNERRIALTGARVGGHRLARECERVRSVDAILG